MRYFVVRNRLVAFADSIPGGEEITAEEYETRREEMYESALEYARNHPPVVPPEEAGEEATEADYQNALREMGVNL